MAARAHDEYDAWVRWRQRRQRRRDAIELFGVVLALQVLLIALFVQFQRGWFADWSFAEPAGRVVIGVAAATMVALLIAPKPVGAWIGLLVHRSGSIVVDVITMTVLAALYVILLPWARLFGRRRLLQRRPALAPWVDRRASWRIACFVDKTSEADRATARHRSAVYRLLGYFAAQRSIFLLIITLLILVAVSLSVLSQTTYLAPFIYTFF